MLYYKKKKKISKISAKTAFWKLVPGHFVIVGKGGHTPPSPFLGQPPFYKIPPFLEIQDVPTFYRLIGKTKAFNDSFN